jgi:putative transcriptional regulator
MTTIILGLNDEIAPDDWRDTSSGCLHPCTSPLLLHNDLLCNDSDPSCNTHMSLHNRIAVFRAERGISRRQLAEAVGVNPQTIGYLERGDYKPSLELALKIARHFGVAVEMLFSLDRFPMTFGRAGEGE